MPPPPCHRRAKPSGFRKRHFPEAFHGEVGRASHVNPEVIHRARSGILQLPWTRASRRNRPRAVPSARYSGRMTFMATSRPIRPVLAEAHLPHAPLAQRPSRLVTRPRTGQLNECAIRVHGSGIDIRTGRPSPPPSSRAGSMARGTQARSFQHRLCRRGPCDQQSRTQSGMSRAPRGGQSTVEGGRHETARSRNTFNLQLRPSTFDCFVDRVRIDPYSSLQRYPMALQSGLRWLALSALSVAGGGCGGESDPSQTPSRIRWRTARSRRRLSTPNCPHRRSGRFTPAWGRLSCGCR